MRPKVASVVSFVVGPILLAGIACANPITPFDSTKGDHDTPSNSSVSYPKPRKISDNATPSFDLSSQEIEMTFPLSIYSNLSINPHDASPPLFKNPALSRRGSDERRKGGRPSVDDDPWGGGLRYSQDQTESEEIAGPPLDGPPPSNGFTSNYRPFDADVSMDTEADGSRWSLSRHELHFSDWRGLMDHDTAMKLEPQGDRPWIVLEDPLFAQRFMEQDAFVDWYFVLKERSQSKSFIGANITVQLKRAKGHAGLVPQLDANAERDVGEHWQLSRYFSIWYIVSPEFIATTVWAMYMAADTGKVFGLQMPKYARLSKYEAKEFARNFNLDAWVADERNWGTWRTSFWYKPPQALMDYFNNPVNGQGTSFDLIALREACLGAAGYPHFGRYLGSPNYIRRTMLPCTARQITRPQAEAVYAYLNALKPQFSAIVDGIRQPLNAHHEKLCGGKPDTQARAGDAFKYMADLMMNQAVARLEKMLNTYPHYKSWSPIGPFGTVNAKAHFGPQYPNDLPTFPFTGQAEPAPPGAPSGPPSRNGTAPPGPGYRSGNAWEEEVKELRDKWMAELDVRNKAREDAFNRRFNSSRQEEGGD